MTSDRQTENKVPLMPRWTWLSKVTWALWFGLIFCVATNVGWLLADIRWYRGYDLVHFYLHVLGPVSALIVFLMAVVSTLLHSAAASLRLTDRRTVWAGMLSGIFVAACATLLMNFSMNIQH